MVRTNVAQDQYIRPMPMGTHRINQGFKNSETPARIVQNKLLLMSAILPTKTSKLLEKPRKTQVCGRCWAKICLKTQAEVPSGEVPSLRKTSIDKTNNCLMNSGQGALVRGSDPRQGHRAHTVAGDTWRALVRRMITKQSAAGVRETDDRISRSVSNGEK